MKNFSIIVAMDEENGIGKQGDLAWRLSADLKHFKEVTMAVTKPGHQNAVIMGRKTWDSLPVKFRPLPGRLNVVLSSNSDLQLPSEVLVFSSIDEALMKLSSLSLIDKIYVMGGAQIYAQSIHHPACQGLYVTHVNGDFDCDVFFPEIPEAFSKIEESPLMQEAAISFQFTQYQRA